jgi:hypothetical protein
MGKKNIVFNSLLGTDWVEEDMAVDGVIIPAARGKADISDLHFWVDNPRVYDEVHSSGLIPDEITTEDIFKRLSNFHDAISLRKKIYSDGAQRDAVIVAKDITGKTDRYIVYEGNTRLSVFMSLFKEGAKGDWSKIKVILLDLTDLNPDLVITYIGDRHLNDEVNKWATHKGARYYHRLVKTNISNGYTESQSFAEVARKFSKQITKGIVKKNYDVIEFMETRNMGVKLQADQYSYWIEYFQNAKNQNVRNFFNDPKNLKAVDNPKINAYDDMMVDKVTNGKITGEVERVTASGAHSFRKDITNLSNFFDTKPREAKKLITNLLNGTCSLTEASDLAVAGGAADSDYKMLKDFHKKIFASDTRKLRIAVKKYDDLLDTIKEIQSKLKLTHIDLSKEYKRIKRKKTIK